MDDDLQPFMDILWAHKGELKELRFPPERAKSETDQEYYGRWIQPTQLNSGDPDDDYTRHRNLCTIARKLRDAPTYSSIYGVRGGKRDPKLFQDFLEAIQAAATIVNLHDSDKGLTQERRGILLQEFRVLAPDLPLQMGELLTKMAEACATALDRCDAFDELGVFHSVNNSANIPQESLIQACCRVWQDGSGEERPTYFRDATSRPNLRPFELFSRAIFEAHGFDPDTARGAFNRMLTQDKAQVSEFNCD